MLDGSVEDGFVGTKTGVFAVDSQVATIEGLKRAGELRVGDLVLTCDNGYQPVMGIAAREAQGPAALAAPVLVPANRFGPGLPSCDLTLPADQWVRAPQGFAAGEILIEARDLTRLPGVVRSLDMRMPMVEVSLVRHDLILVGGLWAETASTHPSAPARARNSARQAERIRAADGGLPNLRLVSIRAAH